MLGVKSLESAFDCDRALVIGIGGCGDVVGAIPTARLLESHGVEVILGGVAWERIVVDPIPGPRHLSDIRGIERLNDGVGLATGETRTEDGIEFAETKVARFLDEELLLVDIAGGARGVAAALDDAVDQLDIDLIIGTDSGGDVLAAGHEPGIKSPLTDAVMLAALTSAETDACLGVFGYGSDGELTVEEVTAAISRSASRDGLLGAWGLTPKIIDELLEVLDIVTTEASRLPVAVARGKLGSESIRDGKRSVELTPSSTVTFYLDPESVGATSELHEHVVDTDGFQEAQRALEQAGYKTELDLERELATQD